MLQIAERVNDWNGSVLGHSLNCLLGEGAQDDGVYPAFEIMRDVTQFLSRVQSLLRLIHKERGPAQARHPRFERQPGSQGRLLEEHHHLLACKSAAKIRRT